MDITQGIKDRLKSNLIFDPEVDPANSTGVFHIPFTETTKEGAEELFEALKQVIANL